MAFNVGILAGMGERYRQRRDEEQKQREREADRNQNILTNAANIYMRMAENPATRDEARSKFLQLGMQATMHDPYKPVPKELLDATHLFESMPIERGSPSWLGGQTERQIPTQPASIPSGLRPEVATGPPTSPPSILPPELPESLSLGQVEGGGTQGRWNTGIPNYPAPERRLPEAQNFTVPTPAPPSGYRLPVMLSSSELQSRASQALRESERIKTDEAIRQTEAAREARRVPVPRKLREKIGVGETEYPEVLTAASGIYREEADAAARAEAGAAERAQRLQIAQMNIEDRQERAKDANEMRKMIAGMNIDTRKLLAQLALGNREVPASISKEISESADIYKIMNGIEGMLEDPDVVKELQIITGWGGTTINAVGQTFGMTSQIQEDYATNLGLLFTIISHPIFGAAFTVPERVQARKFIPELVKYPGQALNQIRALKGWTANRVYNHIQQLQVPATKQKAVQQAMKSGFSVDVLRAYGEDPAFDTLAGAKVKTSMSVTPPSPDKSNEKTIPGLGTFRRGPDGVWRLVP